MKRFVFDNEKEFIRKLKELRAGGVSPKQIETVSPYSVHGVSELLEEKSSQVRLFALAGALTGLIAGFAFTIFTVRDWPLMSSAKPYVSVPAFLVIAFALTILFGALASFIGFLVTAKLPGMKRIVSEDVFTNEFEIHVDGMDE
jgi:hypothetical protein